MEHRTQKLVNGLHVEYRYRAGSSGTDRHPPEPEEIYLDAVWIRPVLSDETFLVTSIFEDAGLIDAIEERIAEKIKEDRERMSLTQ